MVVVVAPQEVHIRVLAVEMAVLVAMVRYLPATIKAAAAAVQVGILVLVAMAVNPVLEVLQVLAVPLAAAVMAATIIRVAVAV